MSEYTPDSWVMLKMTYKGNPTYKILAGWAGSYLNGASWKLNSGITKIEESGDYYLFHGYSGSVYNCHKKLYGLSGYTASILESFYKKAEDQDDVTIECLHEDQTDFLSIEYAND
jgi:hypothetical protein